jgi:tetrahydromethanopterin S-methyltransferase subunit F
LVDSSEEASGVLSNDERKTEGVAYGFIIGLVMIVVLIVALSKAYG